MGGVEYLLSKPLLKVDAYGSNVAREDTNSNLISIMTFLNWPKFSGRDYSTDMGQKPDRQKPDSI